MKRILLSALRPATALLPVLAAVPAACFSGDPTIGAICHDARDCGPAQACRHELCGRCGNGAHEASELCYADPVAVEGLTGVQRFRVADLDGDDRDEVVTSDAAGVLVHAAPTGGLLLAEAIADVGPVTAFALGDADFDGDGDIVAVVGTGVVVLAAGDDGVFAPVLELDVGHAVAEATVIARLDLPATLAFVDDAGSLFVIDLVEGATAVAIDVGTQVHIGPAVHFDDDGVLDLAFVDERQNRMGVVIGGAWDSLTRVDVGRGPTAVVAYDRDRDGRLDFMTLDRFGRTVTLVSASADRGLRVLDSLAFDTVPITATAFDADLDGTADVFVGTDAAVEFWRGEAGRHPEGATFDIGGVSGIGVGRFGAVPVFEIVTLADGRVRRQAVMP